LRNSPALQNRDLEGRITRLAQDRGTTPARFRRLVGFAVLCETLAEAVAQGMIPLFFVKGGVAIELRLGLAARATRDLDVGLCAEPEQLLTAFDRALTVRYGDFALRRRGEARVLNNGTHSLAVAVTLRGRAWATVDVDLAPATMDAQIEDVEPLALHELGLGEPRVVPCLALSEQVSQKIHALTEPTPRGRPNTRARDALDILLLDSRLGTDVDAVRAACERTFAKRALHEWPVFRFEFPSEWTPTLALLAQDAGYDTADATTIESRFNTYLARLHGANVMSGYEYQFVSLQPQSVGSAEPFVTPFVENSFAYQHFTELTKGGWRVRTMTPNPRYPDQLLLLLERELP
jgi:Nucleotidyl transferase AbiEii toxin, Type IV TA system